MRKSTRSLQERIAARVDKTTGCWLWTGRINPKGYAYISVDGRLQRAHRVTYELYVRPIPDGLEIDHLCRVRHCVNPDHLEAVTRRVNLLRGDGLQAQRARQTHCIAGHPFTPENIYWFGVNRRQRQCKACQRRRNRERWRRRVPQTS